MSMRAYGASAVIVEHDFVVSIAKEELESLLAVLQEALDDETINLDDIASELEYEDEDELRSQLGDSYEKFSENLAKLHEKFYQVTGMTLEHICIDQERDDAELDDGHYFAVPFDEVYQVTEKAKAINPHWSYERWSAYA